VSIGGTGEQTTPVIVGIGECRDLVPGDFTAASSLVDMLVRAGKMALDDSNFQPQLRRHIDTVMMTRTFADSSPMWPAPFGKVRNYPRAVAASSVYGRDKRFTARLAGMCRRNF
jgi:hypothetical protein